MGKDILTKSACYDKIHVRNYVHKHVMMCEREIFGVSAGNLTNMEVTKYKPGDRYMPVQKETVKQSRSDRVRATLGKGTVKQPAVLHIDLDQSTRLCRRTTAQNLTQIS